MIRKNHSIKKIFTFLSITLAGSFIFYYLIITNGSLQAYGGAYVLGLMWTPGIAGIITELLFEHNLKGMGWRFGKFKYLLWAYFIPFIYCLVVYGITWLTGLGTFPADGVMAELRSTLGTGLPTAVLILIYVADVATIGFIGSFFSAMGEEIGWRGVLLPELAKIMSFPRASLVSGIIWTLWHLPLIFFADYNLPGVPKWYAAVMFSILVIGISYAFAWLRIKSGSLWTGVVLHASHNIFVQGLFTPLTGVLAITPFIIDEFGAGLAIAGVVVALIFLSKAKQLNPTG
ncbi:MAG TPA: type II CAAX endopeptidase family protein [Longilinea sp.]|nr:type II CAAX endopeptidase family protein [Longilinea sp.]